MEFQGLAFNELGLRVLSLGFLEALAAHRNAEAVKHVAIGGCCQDTFASVLGLPKGLRG